jgi:hypothetical protein
MKDGRSLGGGSVDGRACEVNGYALRLHGAHWTLREEAVFHFNVSHFPLPSNGKVLPKRGSPVITIPVECAFRGNDFHGMGTAYKVTGSLVVRNDLYKLVVGEDK